MHPVIATLLAICTVHAKRTGPVINRMYTWDNLPEPSSYIPRHPSQTVDFSLELEPPQWDTQGHWSENSWQIPDYSQEVSDEVPSQNEDVIQQQAPPYYQSLHDLDEAIDDITSHFTMDALLKNSRKYRYLVLSHVINELTKHVAYNGWRSYEDNYTGLVKNFVEQAGANPRRAAKNIKCIFNDIKQRTDRIRSLINNRRTQFVCQTHPTACDDYIYSSVRMSGDEVLQRQAMLLITTGRAATNFLKSYANAFELISTQDVYRYITQAKEEIRDLVNRNAVARQALYPDGEPRCSQRKSPRVHEIQEPNFKMESNI